MSITHRLGDEWIAAYAAGSLSEGQSVFVASHLSLLPDARKTVSAAEAVGGALLDGIEPDVMAPDALARTLALLGDPAAEAPRPAPRKRDAVLPAPLRDWLGRDLDALKWSLLGPGMRKTMLWRGENDQRLWMLRARPGVRIPRHGHSGTEMTLVLKGSFSDRSGTFRRGDVEVKEADDPHGLAVGTEDECICLAITEGPMRFEGLIARLLQPFIGL